MRLKPGSKRAAPGARRAPAEAPTDFFDLLIAGSTQALGLTIDPAWHGSIKFNLGLILRLAAVFDSFPLPDDAEPGPVFHA
jgi:Protein of unknown function (DUF4089)